MRMTVSCHLCYIDFVDKVADNFHEEIPFELRADGIYNLSCSKGHSWTLVTTDHNYQMLFEIGYMALIDGYTREAVTSFATSLERFYEYCVELFVLDEGIDYKKHKKTWSLISKSSERQLGAFYYSFLMKFKEIPVEQKVVESKASLRNRVIHGGHIPSTKEASEYGEFVFDLIMSVHHKLKDNIRPEVFAYVSDMAFKTIREKQGLEEDSPLVMGLHRQTVFPRHTEKDNHLNVKRFEDVSESIDIFKNTMIKK